MKLNLTISFHFYYSQLQTAQTNLVNVYHSEGKTKSVDSTSYLLPMTSTLVVFPFSCNNTQFNNAKEGDEHSLTPTIVEVLDDFFMDEDDFKNESTYEDYCNKRTISCVLFEMVKDGPKKHHSGFTRDDAEEACKERIEMERVKEKREMQQGGRKTW